MKINVVTAIGKAKTKLGAFDAALIEAGIANTNIICLSSVVPPHAEIVFDKPEIDPADFGKRLYVVMARRDTDKIGKIAAGVGWVMEKNGRFGLFVERFIRTPFKFGLMLKILNIHSNYTTETKK